MHVFYGLQKKQSGYVHYQKKSIGEIMPPYISISHFSVCLGSSLVQISVLQGAPAYSFSFLQTMKPYLPPKSFFLVCSTGFLLLKHLCSLLPVSLEFPLTLSSSASFRSGISTN